MATVYFATNGDDWFNHTNWPDHNVHECAWFAQESYGYQDDEVEFIATDYPNPCEQDAQHETDDTDAVILHLWLRDNNLAGTLPDEVFLLTNVLEVLSIYTNPELTGTIPTRIGLLTHILAIAASTASCCLLKWVF